MPYNRHLQGIYTKVDAEVFHVAEAGKFLGFGNQEHAGLVARNRLWKRLLDDIFLRFMQIYNIEARK